MAWRTAGSPPRSTCSAIGRCSSGTVANTAERCSRLGRSFLGLGFDGRSRRPLGRSDAGWPSRRLSSRRGLSLPSLLRFSPPRPSGLPPRRRPSRPPPPRSRPRPFGASCVVTPGPSLPVPVTSSRSGSVRAGFGGRTERISMPSMRKSASTLTTSPSETPSGINDPASSPLGSLAPAARQVQVPSGRVLVSSTSILRDIDATR